MVLQKNVLFTGTIYDNIRWGDENASDEEVQRECVKLAAGRRVCKMNFQLDTIHRSYRVETMFLVDRNRDCVSQERY